MIRTGFFDFITSLPHLKESEFKVWKNISYQLVPSFPSEIFCLRCYLWKRTSSFSTFSCVIFKICNQNDIEKLILFRKDEYFQKYILRINVLNLLRYFKICTAWKVFVFRVILVRIFPHSDWIRRDRYSVSLRIQYECGKIRTRKTPNMDTFHIVLPSKNYI